jgi:ribonuclease P protein subunit RPR2
MIEIAEERIEILFKSASENFSLHPERSHRYVAMARNIAKKYNLKIPETWRRRFCKRCHHFLQPGSNCKIRLSGSSVNIKCLECGETVRIPYTREKKERRRRKFESNTF